MGYTDYEYYVRYYRCGTSPVIPEESYPFFAEQGEQEIDRATFGKIRENQSLLTDEVRKCSCAVAEVLYKAEKMTETAYGQGLAGPLVSWSNDGESGSVDISHSSVTEDGKNRKIRSLINAYLANTDLLYLGAE